MGRAKLAVGQTLKIASFLILFCCFSVGMVLCWDFALRKASEGRADVDLILFPLFLGVAPWHALWVQGNWLPVALLYGGIPSAWALGKLGDKLVVEHYVGAILTHAMEDVDPDES